jgi:serine/threonine protein kinase
MISFHCPICGQRLRVREDLAGKKGKCAGCQSVVDVPQATETAAAISPPPASGRIQPSVPRPEPPPISYSDLKTLAPDSSLDANQAESEGPAGAAHPAGQPNPALYDFLAPPQAVDELGRLGHYRVLKVLGAGGMGVVYKAEDLQLRRPVALKAMLPTLAVSPSNRQRFLREAQAAAAVVHDHIVTIFHVGEDRGIPFLAMQLLEGQTLEDRLQRSRRLPAAQVVRIGREIAEGLAAAHERGLIHRDIKPGNIWLEAERQRVKILDFGLARSARGDSHLTQSGAIVGTPAYMAPEQACGQAVDPRSDLFSLGCVLYRLCTGELPFKGKDTLATLAALAVEIPRSVDELNPEVPPALADLIMRLLSKDAGQRPPSARAVVKSLAAIEAGQLGSRPARPAGAERLVAGLPQAQLLGTPAPDISPYAIERRPSLRSRSAETEEEFAPSAPQLLGIPVWLVAVLGGVLSLGAVLVIVLVALRSTPTPPRSSEPPPSSALVEVKPQPPKTNPPVSDPQPKPPEPVNIDPPPQPVNPPPTPLAGDSALAPYRKLHAYNAPVHWLTYSPDGKYLAGRSDHTLTIRLWSSRGGLAIRKFAGEGRENGRILFSPDSKKLAAYGGPSLYVWDVETTEQLHNPKVTNPGGQVIGMTFSRDSATVYFAVRIEVQGTWVLQIFDLAAKKEKARLLGHTNDILHCLISPDCTRAVSTSADGTTRVWDLTTSLEMHQLDTPGRAAKCIAVSPDGKQVLSSHHERSIYLWDVETGRKLKTFVGRGENDTVAFSADGRLGLSGGWGSTVRVWDLQTGKRTHELQGDSIVTAITAAPSGTAVLSGTFAGNLFWHRLKE